jgi:hypothetical protein
MLFFGNLIDDDELYQTVKSNPVPYQTLVSRSHWVLIENLLWKAGRMFGSSDVRELIRIQDSLATLG